MCTYQDIVALWNSFDIKTEADLETYLDNFKILFAYNSNKIENANTTYEDTYEVFKHGRVSNYTGDVRTLAEIQNQKLAYAQIVKYVASHEPITEKLVLEFHRIITQGTYGTQLLERGEVSGNFKKHHYVVGINEIGAAPETVSEEINELLDEMHDTKISSSDILTAAAYFHAKFENIHPFADGNGRTGRILLSYFLMINNHPPLTVFDEDRNDYYRALDAFHEHLKVEPLRSFFEAQTIKTWKKTVERTLASSRIER